MERLCIYVFYDRENHVDRYIEYMLQCLRACVSKLYVVCNCTAKITGLERVERYADKVFIRKNVGFDAGAYKDFFCHLSTWDEIKVYDEVILANDTFYGPFYPLSDMFHKMESCKADFWSVTEHPQGELENGKTFGLHYQSWFLVIKSTLLRDQCFKEFWVNMEYPNTVAQTIEYFELRFTDYFKEKGFKGASYMSGFELDIREEYNQNPYIWYSNELISKAKVPFFKKKALYFNLPGYINAIDALSYVESNTNYDTGLIWENVYRLCETGENFSFDYKKVDEFYHSHDRIYIYGAGEFGRKVARYFLYRNWKFEEFLQTDVVNGEKHKRFRDVIFEDNDGIILAVGEKYIYEVTETVRKCIGAKQVLSPVFGHRINL